MVTNRHQGYAGALAHEPPHYCSAELKVRAQVAFFAVLASVFLFALSTSHV